MLERKQFRSFVMAMLLIAVSGCSFPISQQLRREVGEDLSFDMVLKASTNYKGSMVLWGGQIIETLHLTIDEQVVP